MSQENIKIDRIKKSSHVAKIVSKILMIVCIVGTVISLGTGIYFIANHKNLNSTLEAEFAKGDDIEITKQVGAFNLHLVNISASDLLNKSNLTNIDSSIPAVKEALEAYPYSFSIGFYLVIIGWTLVFLTVSIYLINRVFTIIEKEETPFNNKVLKNLLVSLIIIDVIVGFSFGLGYGALGGLITWAVYTIMDYGRTLQKQYDETL